MRDGVITTTATWTAPDGHVTDLRYAVFTDRARPGTAIVRLDLIPHWSGQADVTDLMDGTPATLTTGVTVGWDTTARRYWQAIRAKGTGLIAGLASQVVVSPGARQVTDTAGGSSAAQTVGQRIQFRVSSGHSYSVTKYVGIVTGPTAAAATAAARQQSKAAAAAGFSGAVAENTAAWRPLWAGRIDVLGNEALATEVNASEFYLWASTLAGSDWSISPAGLSSNDYNGHIFWDAETWMYPALLAQHPGMAAGIDAYRLPLAPCRCGRWHRRTAQSQGSAPAGKDAQSEQARRANVTSYGTSRHPAGTPG